MWSMFEDGFQKQTTSKRRQCSHPLGAVLDSAPAQLEKAGVIFLGIHTSKLAFLWLLIWADSGKIDAEAFASFKDTLSLHSWDFGTLPKKKYSLRIIGGKDWP